MQIRHLIDQLESIIKEEGHEEIPVVVWIPNANGFGQYYSSEIELQLDKYKDDIELCVVSFK